MSANRCFISFYCRGFFFFGHRILNIITIFLLCSVSSCCVFGEGITSPLSLCGPATHSHTRTHTLEAGPFVQAYCAAGRWAIYRLLIPSPASPEKENKVPNNRISSLLAITLLISASPCTVSSGCCRHLLFVHQGFV